MLDLQLTLLPCTLAHSVDGSLSDFSEHRSQSPNPCQGPQVPSPAPQHTPPPCRNHPAVYPQGPSHNFSLCLHFLSLPPHPPALPNSNSSESEQNCHHLRDKSSLRTLGPPLPLPVTLYTSPQHMAQFVITHPSVWIPPVEISSRRAAAVSVVFHSVPPVHT